MLNTHSPRTLLDLARPDGATAKLATTVGAVLFGVCLLTLSAKIKVPFWPVPMTMQTLVVLMLGMAYGSRMAAGTVLAYLAAGAAGLPVFAGTPERGIGIAYMMGPTGGFLLGFLVAAWLVGLLAERGFDRTLARCAAAMVIGNALILLVGVAWLAAPLGVAKAIEVGFTPFMMATLLKTALGTVAMPLVWRVIERRSALRGQH